MATFEFFDDFELDEFDEPTRWDTSGNVSFLNGDLVLEADGTYSESSVDTTPYEFKKNIIFETKFKYTFDGTNSLDASFYVKNTVGSGYAGIVIVSAASGVTIAAKSYDDHAVESDNQTPQSVSWTSGDAYWIKIVEDVSGNIYFYYKKDTDENYTSLYFTTVKPFLLSSGCYARIWLSPWTTPPLGSIKLMQFSVITGYSEWDNAWFGHMNCEATDDNGWWYGYCFMTSGWSALNYWPPSRLWDKAWPYSRLFRTGSTDYYVYEGGYRKVTADSSFYPDLSIEGDFFFHIKANLDYTEEIEFKFKVNDKQVIFNMYHTSAFDTFTITIDGSEVFSDDFTDTSFSNLYVRLKNNTLTFSRADGIGDVYSLYADTDFLSSPATYTTEYLDVSTATYTKIYICEFYGETNLPVDRTGALAPTFENSELYAVLVWTPPGSSTPAYMFHCTGLTGGTSSDLDGIDPTDIDGTGEVLRAGSAAWVIESDNTMSLYRAINEAGATSDPPDIIIPDSNPGNWYWQFVRVQAFMHPYIVKHTNLSSAQSFPAEYAKAGIISHVWDTNSSGYLRDTALEISEAGTITPGTSITGDTLVLALPRRLRDLII